MHNKMALHDLMSCCVTCTCKWLYMFCCRCSYKNENELLQLQGGSFIGKHQNETAEERHVKKLKVDDGDKQSVRSGNQLPVSAVKHDNKPAVTLESDTEPAPPFYFNLHRHSPKGPKLLRVNTVIQVLRNAGYRASRTHFDREAVRTNASLSTLITILAEAANINVQ
jgi:tRNA G26 N,N-dimethylase Trm1